MKYQTDKSDSYVTGHPGQIWEFGRFFWAQCTNQFVASIFSRNMKQLVFTERIEMYNFLLITNSNTFEN